MRAVEPHVLEEDVATPIASGSPGRGISSPPCTSMPGHAFVSVGIHAATQNMLFILLLKVHEIRAIGSSFSGLLLVHETCVCPLCMSVCLYACSHGHVSV